MFLSRNGGVGIGMTGPQVPLHVIGQQSGSVGSYAQVARVRGGSALVSLVQEGGLATAYPATSIMCNRLMVGEGFYAFSDNRIKTDISLINDNFALQQVNAIESKEYHYIDYARKKRLRPFGFIAQEVKDIIPNAVTLNNDFVPDELRMVKILYGLIAATARFAMNPRLHTPNKSLIKRDHYWIVQVILCWTNPETKSWTPVQFRLLTPQAQSMLTQVVLLLRSGIKRKLQIPNLDISSNNTGLCRFYFSNDASGNDEVMKDLTLDISVITLLKRLMNDTILFLYGKK